MRSREQVGVMIWVSSPDFSLINLFYYSFRSGYGSGDGPRHITRLNCSGGENTILDCYRENATISPCGPADVMAIRCSE